MVCALLTVCAILISRLHTQNEYAQLGGGKRGCYKQAIFFAVLSAFALAGVVTLGVLLAHKSKSDSSSQSLAEQLRTNTSKAMLAAMDKSTNPCDDFYQVLRSPAPSVIQQSACVCSSHAAVG